jgi:hypothetical protein
MRQNVDPKVWGPSAWSFLHHCVTACDESCSNSYQKFLELLPEVLPCEKCREHSKVYIAANPVDTSNLVSWLDRFRSAVAKRKVSEGGAALPGGCKGCNNAAKQRMALLVLGAVVACVALGLLVVGLVKLTKASRTK